MKIHISILFILLLTANCVYGQKKCCNCESESGVYDDFIYTRQAVSETKKQSHPFFLVENNLSGISTENDKFTLSIDTSMENEFNIRFNRLEHYTLVYEFNGDTNKYPYTYNCFIKDRINNQKTYFTSMIGFYGYLSAEYIKQKNCYTQIGLVRGRKGAEKEFAIFDYQTKKISRYRASGNYDLLGNSDTSIFILARDKFVLDKKKYKKGDILAVSINGIFVLPVKASDIKIADRYFIGFDYSGGYKGIGKGYFYNGSIIAEPLCLTIVTMDCRIKKYYRLNIYKDNRLIDSLYFESNPEIYYTDATNQAEYSESRLIWENKVYANNGDILEWNYNYWKSQITALEKSNYSIEKYYMGDTLFIEKQMEVEDSIGFDAASRLTYNGIQLKEKSNQFKLVMAFDIRTNKFLGYPAIKFVGTKYD